MIKFQGQTLTWQEAELKFGIAQSTIRDRLKRGWSLERALTEVTWRNATIEMRRKLRKDRLQGAPGGGRSIPYTNPMLKLPPGVLEERDKAINSEHTLGQILLGDPLPGRSALDKQRANKNERQCTNGNAVYPMFRSPYSFHWQRDEG